MKELSFEKMESVNAGDWAHTCVVLGAGSVVYAYGAISNWWNPIGWVSLGFVIADGVCLAYAASQI